MMAVSLQEFLPTPKFEDYSSAGSRTIPSSEAAESALASTAPNLRMAAISHPYFRRRCGDLSHAKPRPLILQSQLFASLIAGS
jgi:hypothetical protein